MKNTTIPLDMLFIGPDLRIVGIVEKTKPLSLRPITCPHPTFIVIEFNAGEAKKYHLTPGMKLGKE